MKIPILILFIMLFYSSIFSQSKDPGKGEITTMKITLTSIYVPKPSEALDFYTTVLGFVEKMHLPEANLAIIASPQEPEGVQLLLEPNDNPLAKTYQEGLYNSGLPVIVFGTTDIHKEFERLKDLGVYFKKEPTTTDWGIEAIFDDNCGNWIQIYQPKPKTE